MLSNKKMKKSHGKVTKSTLSCVLHYVRRDAEAPCVCGLSHIYTCAALQYVLAVTPDAKRKRHVYFVLHACIWHSLGAGESTQCTICTRNSQSEASNPKILKEEHAQNLNFFWLF